MAARTHRLGAQLLGETMGPRQPPINGGLVLVASPRVPHPSGPDLFGPALTDPDEATTACRPRPTSPGPVLCERVPGADLVDLDAAHAPRTQLVPQLCRRSDKDRERPAMHRQDALHAQPL